MDGIDNWRKSTKSTGNGGECLEAGSIPGAVFIRDTKDAGDGPVIRMSAAAWSAFLTTLR